MAKDYQKELDALPEIKHLKSAIDQLQSDLTQGGLPFDTRQQLIHRLFRFDMVIGAVMTCDSIIKLQLNALTDDDRELHDQLEGAITNSIAKTYADLAKVRSFDWEKLNPQRGALIERFNREIKS